VLLHDEPPSVVSFLDRAAGFEPLKAEVRLMVANPLQTERLDQVPTDLPDLAAPAVRQIGQDLVNTEDVGSEKRQ